MANINKKVLEKKDDICVMKIYDYQWSTFGELISSSKFQEILKNPDNYYFDFVCEFGYGEEKELPYMKIMKFGDK